MFVCVWLANTCPYLGGLLLELIFKLHHKFFCQKKDNGFFVSISIQSF